MLTPCQQACSCNHRNSRRADAHLGLHQQAKPLLESALARRRATAGPRSLEAAETLDGVGRQLSHVRVEGPSPYDLTADLLTWGAAMMLTGHATAAGALGPVDAFGFEALVDGCGDLGLRRVG